MKIRLELEGKNAGSISYKGPEAAQMAAMYLDTIEANEVEIHIARDDGTKAFAEFSGEFLNMSAVRFILSAAKIESEPFTLKSEEDLPQESLTLKERLEMFLRFEYPGVWFSSLEVKTHYESVYGKINLSTVSTYLARMHRDNLLERKGNHNQREYRFIEEVKPLINLESASMK